MTSYVVTDPGGCKMTLMQYNGYIFPVFPLEAIQNLETFVFRDDDIVISAYPKAGTHWVWEIVRMLQEEKTELPVVEKDDYMLEWKGEKEYFTSLPSPRILNTHVLFRHLPGLRRSKCKIIYVTRNPRDVAVSFYNHHYKLTSYYNYKGTWNDYFQLFLRGELDYGSFFDHVREWDQAMTSLPDLDALHVSFEDLKENPESEIKRIAGFLGKTADDSFIQSVCDKCGFENMQKRKGKFDLSSDGETVMYRKGLVGDWQNWFTAEQVEELDKVCEDKLFNTSIRFRYNLT